MKCYNNIYENIISPESLFLAWDSFHRGKQGKRDVQEFEWELEQNIFQLHRELRRRTYRHGSYVSFYIQDPKQRHIHKAAVRDRVLHHAVFSVLSPIFEPTFLAHSYSCRIGKGTHRGVKALENIIRKVSQNYSKPCFILKCDVSRFFDSIDHGILLAVLRRRIKDDMAIWLLREIIESFTSDQFHDSNPRGLPIGNLTSQLFANIYLNEFDRFVKHTLKIEHYVRYTDDFVIVSGSLDYLQAVLKLSEHFLNSNLALKLHPKKITVRKASQGIDFLGYIVLPDYRLLRVKTKKRIFTKMEERVREFKAGVIGRLSLQQSFQSYLGVLSHANTYRVRREYENRYRLWLGE